MNRLTESEAMTIRNMGRYWREVVQRENGGEILRAEMIKLYNMIGLKLLWIALDHAQGFSPSHCNDCNSFICQNCGLHIIRVGAASADYLKKVEISHGEEYCVLRYCTC